MRRADRLLLAVIASVSVAALLVTPAAAQSDDADCSCRPVWQIVAAIVLGAFLAVAAMLLATRWRRLLNRS